MSKLRTHYDNLKVARNAPLEVIEAAYRALARIHHPDVSTSKDATRIMSIINAAYSALSDRNRRREHDEWILRMEGKAQTGVGERYRFSLPAIKRELATLVRKVPQWTAAKTSYWGVLVLVMIVIVVLANVMEAVSDKSKSVIHNIDVPLVEKPTQQIEPEQKKSLDPPIETTPHTIDQKVSPDPSIETTSHALDILPLPTSGVMWSKLKEHRNWPKIIIKTDSTNGNVYVKVISADSNSEVARLFVRQNEQAAVRLTPGEYKIHYATGGNWYGEHHLFGTETETFECAKQFTLWMDEEGATGYVVSLIPQANGNLPFHRIQQNDF